MVRMLMSILLLCSMALLLCSASKDVTKLQIGVKVRLMYLLMISLDGAMKAQLLFCTMPDLIWTLSSPSH